MGETADQIRDQVDQARDQATDRIIQLEQHVTDAAAQVKESLDWRHHVEERPSSPWAWRSRAASCLDR